MQMKPINQEAIAEDNQIRTALANLIKENRKRQKLTVREVVQACERLGWRTGPTQYNRIEKGLADVSISQSRILGRVLSISSKEFIGCLFV